LNYTRTKFNRNTKCLNQI